MAARYWVGGHPTNANWNQTGSGTTNWAATSGGSAGASVPTSADDVTFDSAGNSNSTISANISVLSVTITSGYTATMTHNAVVTLSGGNWTYGGTYTIAGTSNFGINGNCTITSNGKTWPNNLRVGNASTVVTLNGDLTISGAIACASGSISINKTTSEKLYCNGIGITGAFNGFSGTAELVLTGGTWNASSAAEIINNVTFAGNVTLAATIHKGGTSTIKYNSGTIDTTTNSSTLIISNGSSITFDTSGMTWNNITTGTGINTYTINSLLTVNGTLTIAISGTHTFDGTNGFTVNTLSSLATSALTVSLKESITYTVNSAFTCNTSSVGSIVLFTSAHASTKALINFPNNGTVTCNVLASFTRIEVTGRSVNTFAGTVTDCINVNQFYDYKGTAI